MADKKESDPLDVPRVNAQPQQNSWRSVENKRLVSSPKGIPVQFQHSDRKRLLELVDAIERVWVEERIQSEEEESAGAEAAPYLDSMPGAPQYAPTIRRDYRTPFTHVRRGVDRPRPRSRRHRRGGRPRRRRHSRLPFLSVTER
jgi:hypothetical protein